VTYAELAAQADALARHLARFVQGEGVVALLLPRDSPELFAAELAVLQAGAAYVALDRSFPTPTPGSCSMTVPQWRS